jgi:hypothetical protein
LNNLLFVLQNNQSDTWKEQNRQASNVTFLEHKWGPNTTDEIQKAHWAELSERLPSFSRVVVYVPDDNPEELINWLNIHRLIPEQAVFLIPPDGQRYEKRIVLKEAGLLERSLVKDCVSGGCQELNKMANDFLENGNLP